MSPKREMNRFFPLVMYLCDSRVSGGLQFGTKPGASG
ncbi:hypothetical protein ABIC86_003825 [Paenibacillus sp. DS2363]